MLRHCVSHLNSLSAFQHNKSTLCPSMVNTQVPRAVQASPERTASPPLSLPATYKRLIGRKTGKDFRSVAEVEECEVPEPSQGQVPAPSMPLTLCTPRWLIACIDKCALQVCRANLLLDTTFQRRY